MPTAHEYFETDHSHVLAVVKEVTAVSAETSFPIPARLYLDFDARARFLALYISSSVPLAPIVESLLHQLPTLLDMKCSSVRLPATRSKDPGLGYEITNRGAEAGPMISYRGYDEDLIDGDDLPFTGQIFIYTDQTVDMQQLEKALTVAAQHNLRLRFRDSASASFRTKWTTPKAFVCHDSRDKEIARQIAVGLQQLNCPVWYDEFSLGVGDSLRDRIEEGLKKCRWCIVLLTPHFLAKGGWPKREYTSAFTKEIIENRNVMLPVWNDVDRDAIFEYSPVLADRVGLQWTTGAAEVCRKLFHRIDRDE